MVVHHRYVPFVSYPEEWCSAMLKDAALTMVELLIELARYGLTLKDAHPWNLLFDVCKPVYVDLTSIIPIKDNAKWVGYDAFCRFCLYPLILMAHGQERIARRLLPEYEGILKSELLMLTQDSAVSASISLMMSRGTAVLRQQVAEPLRRLLKSALRPIECIFREEAGGLKSYVDFLKKIRREVESITLPSFKNECSDYDQNSSPSLLCQDAWTAEHRCLHRILIQLQPGSVLNIGGNIGWYSGLASIRGTRVVAFDTDEQLITQLYYIARDHRLPILPLIMDFTDPTPSRGLCSHWAIAATERIQCDMVLALKLIHRVVSKRYLNFDQIVDGLALFSRRWLVVEFVSPEDQAICGRWSDRFSWYALDNFVNTLKKRFASVSILSPHAEPHVLLLCEK